MNKRISPLVTIAIPIYNAERFLIDAIQSVVNQTYKDWILYLINDGSTDKSIDIMREFATYDNRIKIIDDGLNKGLITRLNQSIAMTDSKFYARMDADDIMSVTRIEEQVQFLESHPEIDVLGTSIMTIDNHNNIIGSGGVSGKVQGFIHPTIMGRTEWFKNNTYSEWAVRAEDKELWCRTVSKSNFWALDKPLLFYREFGVPTLRKTLMTQKTLLKIFLRYKQYKKSWIWAIKNIILVIIKMCTYIFFAMIGNIEFIVRRRSRKPVPGLLCLSEKDLFLAIHKE